MHPIDVWNVGSFDRELLEALGQAADSLASYFKTEQQIFLDHDLGRNRSTLRPNNPHATGYFDLKDRLSAVMVQRTIRAYHYTRLTDDEMRALQSGGIHLSTPETLRHRLDALVVAGRLTQTEVDRLYRDSPFHSDQRQAREGKYWMTSHPVAVDDAGVEPLLYVWGGEVASMFIRRDPVLDRLRQIGVPRIVEVAVPLDHTNHGYSAGEAVIATFARSRGAIPEKKDFDLYVKQPLPARAILAIHTEGEDRFAKFGRGYPEGFVDVRIGRWKELTGEDD